MANDTVPEGVQKAFQFHPFLLQEWLCVRYCTVKMSVLLHAPDLATGCSFEHKFHRLMSVKWIQVFH